MLLGAACGFLTGVKQNVQAVNMSCVRVCVRVRGRACVYVRVRVVCVWGGCRDVGGGGHRTP